MFRRFESLEDRSMLSCISITADDGLEVNIDSADGIADEIIIVADDNARIDLVVDSIDEVNITVDDDATINATVVPVESEVESVAPPSNDRLSDNFGEQTLDGGRGDDVLVALGDAGEPIPAQGGSVQGSPLTYDGQSGPRSDAVDTLFGGEGADDFVFMPLLNATEDILNRHRDLNTGIIDWSGNGVAGENDNVHDHWVEGVGHTIVEDYDAATGDRLIIEGHTASVETEQIDDDVLITITSDQGDNGGAHDGDELGTVLVKDTQLDDLNLSVDAGVFHSIELLLPYPRS